MTKKTISVEARDQDFEDFNTLLKIDVPLIFAVIYLS